MEQSDYGQTLDRGPNVGLQRAIIILSVLGFTLTVGPETKSGEPAVETQISCSDPEVPILFLTVEVFRSIGIVEHAFRTEICRYTDESIPVTPVRFLRRVKTTPTSAEPYGYIWAIRPAERKMGYWFFWKDEHETMLKSMPGI